MAERIIDDAWHDLSNIQRDILVTLAREGPAMGSVIHQRMRGDNPQTEGVTVRNLQRLDAAGYIARERSDDDERVIINKLTMDGVALLRRGVLEPAGAINARDEPIP